MSELREAAQAALTAYEKFRDVDDIDGLDGAVDRLRAALAEPKTELRDQHKAFTHWFLGLHETTALAPEDLAWSTWKAALAQPENRPCTCHPDDNPPQPCAQRYALTECKALAQPETAAEPVAWLNRYHAAMVTQDRATANAMGFTTPLYAHPPRDEWRPASEPPEDGRDVVVWCAQERRAVHGMYVRRHPPVVGLVDGWVAPDASKLTHWRDVQPPTEGE